MSISKSSDTIFLHILYLMELKSIRRLSKNRGIKRLSKQGGIKRLNIEDMIEKSKTKTELILQKEIRTL